MKLSEKKCEACEAGTPPLVMNEVMEYLNQITGWVIENNGRQIEKDFSFVDFKESVDFIDKIAKIAEDEGHHPDINLHDYKHVKITLTTHAIKGLSENDFIMAAKIDELIK